MAARDRGEIRITQRQGDGARVQPGVAQALGRFLAKIAERGFQRLAVPRVFAESLIVRDGFRLGVDEKFVGIDSARFAK